MISSEWTDTYASVQNSKGLSKCFICDKNLKNKKVVQLFKPV